jgi:hypothetical protein
MKRFNLLILIALVCSCKKPEQRACFKKSGELSIRTYDFGSFNQLHLKEHLSYKLVQDSINKVIVRGGNNLLNFVEVIGENGQLTIENKNRCNYLRSYEIPEVEIHYTKLINILFEGTERLYNEDTLITDYLTLTLRDGAGHMELNVQAIDINAINTHGWGRLTLKGETQTLRGNLMGDGKFDFRQMSASNHVKLITSSSTDQWVKADGIPLNVELNGIGNVYYYGLPSVINKVQYGEGKLINVQ